MTDRTGTQGCDACDADEPVQYVPPLGYLCARCREPAVIDRLWNERERAFGPYDPEQKP
jgi:hypothetical protein